MLSYILVSILFVGVIVAISNQLILLLAALMIPLVGISTYGTWYMFKYYLERT